MVNIRYGTEKRSNETDLISFLNRNRELCDGINIFTDIDTVVGNRVYNLCLNLHKQNIDYRYNTELCKQYPEYAPYLQIGMEIIHAVMYKNRMPLDEYTVEEIRSSYFNGHKEGIHALEITNDEEINKGVEIINRVISTGRKIYIVCDSDADGMESGLIGYKYFKDIGYDNVEVMTNERRYSNGVNEILANKLIYNEDDIGLIITSDHGSGVADEARYKMLKDRFNCDIIITDHHEVRKDDMGTDAFINPQRKGSKLSSAYSGAVVILALMVNHSLQNNNIYDFSEIMSDAGLTVISDMMDCRNPLNRYLVEQCFSPKRSVYFDVVDNNEPKGINTSRDLGFTISPVLNSCNRMGNATFGLSWIKERDYEISDRKYPAVRKINTARKSLQKELLDRVINGYEDKDNNIIIIALNSFKEDEFANGVYGLIAGSLSRMYKKPCIVIADYGSYYKGSGRSFVDNISFVKMLESINEKGTTIGGGGHKAALGISFDKDNCSLDKFISLCNEELGIAVGGYKKYKFESFIDMEITKPSDINDEIVESSERIGAVGNHFPPFVVGVTSKIVSVEFKSTTTLFVKYKLDCGLTYINFNNKEDFNLNVGDTLKARATIGKDQYTKKYELLQL